MKNYEQIPEKYDIVVWDDIISTASVFMQLGIELKEMRRATTEEKVRYANTIAN